MGLDVMEIGGRIRKDLIFSIRTSYRSVRDHPFYWGMVFFFFFLYRFFPSLFGLLVSSLPVLVCTTALLGILLSFGNPNIPEIEKDDKRTHEVAALKAAVVENNVVLQKDESFSADAHLEKRREVEEKVVEEPMGLGEEREANVCKVDEDMVVLTINDRLMGRTTANEEPKEILGEKQMIEEEGEFGKVELVEKLEFDEDSLIGAAPSAREDIDGATSVGWEEIETPRRKIDLPSGAFSITQDLSWKHAESHSKSFDSDSDCTESSSPDASMADIMPRLDELHPLLEYEASQPPVITLGNSNAISESSNRSHDDSAGSEEEGENQEEEEDDEEEVQGTQGDGTKDVVTWTEDDQKNLMDLGNLELERNRRLESLIAKRMARKLMRMEPAEKNLIDLDSNDPPFSIAPILTRRNPFDLPYDSYEAMGLPPIPGSAPSVLLPRRNPFDLPYEPYEEKPNLTDDGFQQEFTPFQPKDLQFRRHESFSLGVSAEPKQRKHFRSYVLTERMASQGQEYSMLQRQWSEKSDSKVSFVPETESASSVADQEDIKTLAEQELSLEGDLTFDIDHASENVEHESQSSGELDSAEVYPEESRDFDVDGVNMNGVDEEATLEVELHQHHSRSIASLDEPNYNEFHAVEEKYSDASSSSSDIHKKLFGVETDEGSRDLGLKRDDNTEGSSVFIQSSLSESNFNLRNWIVEGGDESQTKEPVYDSSPSTIEKTLSNMTSIEETFFYVAKGVVTSTPSIASDLQVEVSEVGSPPVLVDREDGESVDYEKSTMEISPGNGSTWVGSPNTCVIDENESRSMEDTEISECNVIQIGFSAVNHDSDDPHVPKMIVREAASVSSSSSLENPVGEVGLISEEVHLQSEQYLASLPSSNAEVRGEVQQNDANMKVDTIASCYSNGVSSEDLGSSTMEKFTPSMEEFTVHPSSLENPVGEVGLISEEVHLQSEQYLASLPSSNAEVRGEVRQNDATMKVDTITSCYSNGVPSEDLGSSTMEKSTPSMEEFIVHPSSDGDQEEAQDSSDFLVKSIGEANVQALENEFSMLTAPVLISIPSEFSEIKSTTVPTDIKYNINVRVQNGDES